MLFSLVVLETNEEHLAQSLGQRGSFVTTKDHRSDLPLILNLQRTASLATPHIVDLTALVKLVRRAPSGCASAHSSSVRR